MRLKLKQEQMRKVMNEAERQYKQYVKAFANTHGKTTMEAMETAECEEYRKYCEEVFGRRISKKKVFPEELEK